LLCELLFWLVAWPVTWWTGLWHRCSQSTQSLVSMLHIDKGCHRWYLLPIMLTIVRMSGGQLTTVTALLGTYIFYSGFNLANS